MLITVGGRRLHYDVVGPEVGPVVCMAHCLSADSGVWAEQLQPLLSQGWRVLRLDMRGHGGSDPPQGDYAMADLADDVALVLDFLGVERAHFVGVSIGGMIGQCVALQHGHRLGSAMLCGASPEAVPGGASMWEARFAAMRSAGSLEPLADDAMQRWFTETFKSRRPDRWRQIRDTVASTSTEGYVAGAKAIIDFDVAAKLPAVRTPTLVICGDGDASTPPEGNRRIASLIPGARYQEIAKARHLPMVERPDTFSSLMLEWLAANR